MSELEKLRATLPLYTDMQRAANLRIFFKNSQNNKKQDESCDLLKDIHLKYTEVNSESTTADKENIAE